MKPTFVICAIYLTLVLLPSRSVAQEQDFRFQAPSAPPLDVDFGDDDDDEMGDFSRPPGAPAIPPMPPGSDGRGDARNNGALPPTNGNAPNAIDPAAPFGNGPLGGGAAMSAGGGYGTPGGNFGGTTTTAGKFRFKIVEGEYWRKGMKRQRGNETHVTGDDSRDGGMRRH